MHTSSWLVLLSVLAAMPGRAIAAQQASDSTRLPAVEITATRLPTPPGEVTATVTTLQGEELRRRGIRFVQDALRDVPGLEVVRTGSFGGQTSVFLRGGESDYVKVLVDGVPVNLAGGSFDWGNLTTDNLDRIEIVRGPTSVLYGADAMSGVIQLFTRRGATGSVTTLETEAGSFESTRAFASHRGGGRVGYTASVSRVATDGIFPFNNRFRNNTVTTSLRTDALAETRLVVTARYADAIHHFPTDFAGVPSDSNQFGSVERFTLSGDLARTLSDRAEARLLVAASLATTDANDDPDGTADTLGFGFESRRHLRSRRWMADGRVNLRSDRTVVTVGSSVEIEREALRTRSVSNFGDGAFADSSTFEADRTTVAGYLQGVFDLGGGLGAQGGVRLDRNDAFGTFLTARLGLTAALNGGTQVRASVGSAFKAPTFPELRAQTPFEIGNPNLEPERSVSVEAGVRHQVWKDRIHLDAALFAQRFTDVIQYRFTSSQEPTYFNLARARALGFEVTAEARPTDWLQVQGAYSRVATKVTDAGASASAAFAEGRSLLRRPGHSGRIGVGVIGTQASGWVNVRIVGARDDVDFRPFPAERVVLPRYAAVDLSATVALRSDIVLKGRVENLFNQRYEAVVGFRAPGRALYGGVDIRFR